VIYFNSFETHIDVLSKDSEKNVELPIVFTFLPFLSGLFKAILIIKQFTKFMK